MLGAGTTHNGHLGQRNEKGAGTTSSCKWQWWVSLPHHGPLLPHFFLLLSSYFNSGSKQLVWPKAYLFFVYRCFMNHKRCENLKFIDRIFERSLHLLFFSRSWPCALSQDLSILGQKSLIKWWGSFKFHNWTNEI